MLFCCDCYFTVTFVPSMSIHIKVWSLLHFLLRWGSVWEPAGSRVVGGWTGGPIGCQGHPCNFRIILEEFSCYSSSELSGKDKSLYAFSFFWVDRTLQPEPFCISLTRQSTSDLCFPATHLWLRLLQCKVQQVVVTIFDSFPCLKNEDGPTQPVLVSLVSYSIPYT